MQLLWTFMEFLTLAETYPYIYVWSLIYNLFGSFFKVKLWTKNMFYEFLGIFSMTLWERGCR